MSTSSTDSVDQKINLTAPVVIFVDGEVSDDLYVLESGEVKLFKENQGRLIPVAQLGENEFLGEVSIFTDQTRSTTAIATKDSVIVKLKVLDIKVALKAIPKWALQLMLTLGERLRHTTDILRDHKISGLPNDNEGFSPQDESKYLKLIAEFKKKKPKT